MSDLIDKFQIVAFSTNNNSKTPNDIMEIFLSFNDHKLLRKTKGTLSFMITLKDSAYPTKVMIYSVNDLDKEYNGISDVNCYLMIVDLNQKNYSEELNNLLQFIENNCDITKEFFILGIYEDNLKEVEDAYDLIKDKFQKRNLTNVYELVNIKENKIISEKIMNVLNYCNKNKMEQTKETDEEKGDEGNSCNII